MNTEAIGHFTLICPHCETSVEIANEYRGMDVACSVCEKEFRAVPPFQKTRGVLPPAFTPVSNAPQLCCPFCRCTRFGPAQQKLTTGGVVMITIGFVLIFALVGIVLALVGNRMRETRYQCLGCSKWI